MDDSLTLALTLIEFQDTFAKDDLDIGNFTKIKHKIDTQNAAPTKERMRRTPFGMEDEEENLIEDLLHKHVIQSSSSEWVSAPVLVRMKDGKVRYCIGYRKLNYVTMLPEQMRFPCPGSRAASTRLEATNTCPA